MNAPTSARWMNNSEWEIVSGVFGSTLPFRQRIIITNGLGAQDRPFTIPTSLISSLPSVLADSLAGLIALPPIGAVLGFGVGAGLALVGSVVNAGYLMNVGQYAYPDMSSSQDDRELLVHETAHVWQGKNSVFALSYVYGSAISQCTSGLGAYNYSPGNNWGSYNPEQQASIIEKWYKNGQSESDPLFPYIRDYVRKGKVS